MDASLNTTPGQPPLSAFVSSGMGTQVEAEARDVCYEVLSASLFQPWLFEHTPPSARTAVQTYISAIDRCDLFVWLAGSTTSPAVQAELERAEAAGRPILVFRLPAATRDAETVDWVGRLRRARKTGDVRDTTDLRAQLVQAIGDFVAECVRDRQPVAGDSYLATLASDLHGMAVARWMAVGLATPKAQELASDLTVGRLPLDQLPNEAERLRVLEAPVGAGKTIAAIRYAQEAVRLARDNPTAPLPIWVSAGATPDIGGAVRAALAQAGRPPAGPVLLVVDGLDESPSGTTASAVEWARACAYSQSESRVLLTARPSIVRFREGEAAILPELSPFDATSLVARAFGVSLSEHALYDLAEPLRDAVRRPLFALMLGRLTAVAPMATLTYVGELIDSLVTEALRRSGTPDGERVLATLARLSLDAGVQAIPIRDVTSLSELPSLIATRMVTASPDRMIQFSLPIFREWFGARAVDLGFVEVVDIVASPERLEHWRYAIFLAATTMRRDGVTGLLDNLARSAPGFAGEFLAGAPPPQEMAPAPGSDAAIADSIRNAWSAFEAGLGHLADMVGPKINGVLPTLGVQLRGGGLIYTWSKTASTPPGIALPNSFSWDAPVDPEWGRRKFRDSVSTDPLWAWRIAQEDLKEELQEVLEARALFPDVPAMRAEAAWKAALQLSRSGDHRYEALDSTAVAAHLAALGTAELLREWPMGRRLIPLDPLRRVLATGAGDLRPPYNEPDQLRSSLVWSGFSDQALLDRTRAVYQAAFEIYQGFVDHFFPRFAPWLELALLLPAHVRGLLRPAKGGHSPALTYVIDPLPPTAKTRLEIELTTADSRGTNDWAWLAMEGNAEAIARFRPWSPPWLRATASTTVLEVFGADPATRLAEKWLAADLHRIGWLKSVRV